MATKELMLRDGKRAYYDSNLSLALSSAESYVTVNKGKGHVQTMPELLQRRAEAESLDSPYWQHWFTADSGDFIGQHKRKDVAIIAHGASKLLTPDRINQAYKEGLVNGAARLTDDEIQKLLSGKLMPVYSLDDVKKGSIKRIHYAVVMDLETARKSQSGYQTLNDLETNPTYLSRAGSSAKEFLTALESKFEKSKYGNHHRFDVKPESQGRFVFLGSSDGDGLSGCSILNGNGHFAGVRSDGVRSTPKNSRNNVPTYTQVLRMVKPLVPQINQKDLEQRLKPLFK